MDNLKKALGEELYNKVTAALDTYNSDAANKEAQIKLANLAGGEYVGKGKYDALNETLNGKQTELESANNLIAELKKATKGSEETQAKIAQYESQVAALQEELAATKQQAALKVALLGDKALDVDYLAYKLQGQLKEQGKSLELDDEGNIKGWKDYAAQLKTQFPTQFESSSTKKIDEHKLDSGDDADVVTRASILKMSYNDRVKLYAENPDGYNAAMNN